MAENKKKRKLPFSNIGLGKDRDYFIENLSLLIASGMPIVGAVDSISAEVKSSRTKKILSEIREDIEGGSSLSKALTASGLFKEHTLSLIRLGEESGRLVQNLKVIAVEEEKDRTFRSKLRSAMMYPVFVLGVTIVVGIGIAWFILPKLALVFTQLKLKLPLITKILIGIGTFLGEYGKFVVPLAIVLLIISFYLLFFYKKTKHVGQSLLFLVPGIKQLMKEVEIARFGYLLGTLLEAGLSVTEALDSLTHATEFARYQKLYKHMNLSVEEGNSFKKSFATYKYVNRLIPAPIQHLIGAAELSGNLSKTLTKIGETYEVKADATTKNLTVILEPILLVIVWLGVVAVALAVILPIYSLVGSLNA